MKMPMFSRIWKSFSGWIRPVSGPRITPVMAYANMELMPNRLNKPSRSFAITRRSPTARKASNISIHHPSTEAGTQSIAKSEEFPRGPRNGGVKGGPESARNYGGIGMHGVSRVNGGNDRGMAFRVKHLDLALSHHRDTESRCWSPNSLPTRLLQDSCCFERGGI